MSQFTEVISWGGNHFGQLGLGSQSSAKKFQKPQFYSFNILIKQISCGEDFSAFIAHNGYLYTMGNNNLGRLGIGDKTISYLSSPCLVESLKGNFIEHISCGWGHSVAITESGDAFSWGNGDNGQLGTGSLDTQWSPRKIRISQQFKAVFSSCGARHTGLILKDRTGIQTLQMCGAGEAGQLGNGQRDNQAVLMEVQLGEDVRSVSCGVFHSLILTISGRLFGTGGNSFGQLGIGNKRSSSLPVRIYELEGVYIDKISCWDHSAAICMQGNLYIWGAGVFGEFLTPMMVQVLEKNVREVSIGAQFGIALDIEGKVWAWGSNINGELGQNDNESRSQVSRVSLIGRKNVKIIAAGGCFSICLGQDRNTQERKRSKLSQGRELSRSRSRLQSKSPKKSPGKTLRRVSPQKSRERLKKTPSPQKDRGKKSPSPKLRRKQENNQWQSPSKIDRKRTPKSQSFHAQDQGSYFESQLRDKDQQIQWLIQEKEQLENLLNQCNRKIQNFSVSIEQLQYENQSYRQQMNEMSDTISAMKQNQSKDIIVQEQANQIHTLTLRLKSYEQENLELSQYKEIAKELQLQVDQLSDKANYADKQVKDLQIYLQSNNNQIIDQNQQLASKNEQLTLQNQHMEQKLMYQQAEIEKISQAKENFENANLLLSSDNENLRKLVTQLDNSQRLQNMDFDNELLRKARLYKDKTIQMLNAPSRSLSPLPDRSLSPPRSRTPLKNYSNHYQDEATPSLTRSQLSDEHLIKLHQVAANNLNISPEQTSREASNRHLKAKLDALRLSKSAIDSRISSYSRR